MSITIVPVTCRLDADLQVEASAAAYETQDGDAIPLALLLATMVRESLQQEQACLRQRRQAESAPQTHATPDSTTRPHPGQDCRDGVHSQP